MLQKKSFSNDINLVAEITVGGEDNCFAYYTIIYDSKSEGI